MDAVNEAQLSEGEEDILLGVVWDAVDPALHLRDGLHQQVGVIATQIVEDNGDSGGFGDSRSLRLQAVWAAPRYLPVM